jgi:preprotein translocase subunit SecA
LTLLGFLKERPRREKNPPGGGKINEIEAGLQSLSDDDLRAKTAAWKAELSQIEDNEELARRLNEICRKPLPW